MIRCSAAAAAASPGALARRGRCSCAPLITNAGTSTASHPSSSSGRPPGRSPSVPARRWSTPSTYPPSTPDRGLEVGYVLQRRHDDRSVRVPPSTIRHLVGLLTDSGAASLLERPLDDWLDAVRAHGWKDPTRTVALLRYAHRQLSDLGGINIDAEYASDVWVAARLGIHVAAVTEPDPLRHDHPAVAADRGEALGPAASRVGQDVRQRARRRPSDAVVQPVPRPPRSRRRRRNGHHPRGAGGLPRLDHRFPPGAAHVEHLHHLPAAASSTPAAATAGCRRFRRPP